MLVTEPMERSRVIAVVQAAVAGGVNVVQLRDRTLSAEEVTVAAAQLKLCLGETPLLVNGFSSAARGANATGIHLPENGPQIDVVRGIVGAQALIGRSVHSVNAALRAAEEGADYLVAGTIFASRSHPGITPAGVGFLREVCTRVTAPVIAIGGVTPELARPCMEAGAAGVAVLSAIMHSTDPHAAAAEYWARLVESGGD